MDYNKLKQAMKDIYKALLIIAGLFVAKKAVAPIPDYRGQNLPLSLRNNNPGALMFTGQGIAWRGRTDTVDPNIYRFKNMVYGTRALIKVLNTYYNVHELQTLRDIFTRYAPYGHGNNNPIAYAGSVAMRLNKTIDSKLTWNRDTIKAIVYAITRIESGLDPEKYLPAHVFNEAYNLA